MCDVDEMNLGLSIPVLRGLQGGRDLFVALPSNSVINNFFPSHFEVSDLSESDSSNTNEAAEIAGYISRNQDGYFLGAISYETDSECIFDEATPGSQFGVLRLPLDAQLRTIDGQQRREALRSAAEIFTQVASEHTAVLLYVETTVRRREEIDPSPAEFASINSPHLSAQPANPFEVAATKLSTVHPFLLGRVKSSAHKLSSSLEGYELGEIVDALRRLHVGPTGRVRSPMSFETQDIYNRGTQFLSSLERLNGVESDAYEVATVLDWPSVLKILAGLAYCQRFDPLGPKLSEEQWRKALEAVSFDPSSSPWIDCGISDGLNPTPRPKKGRIAAAVATLAHDMSGRHSNLVSLST